MKKQKWLLLLLVAAMAFALVACSDGTTEEAKDSAFITISLGRDTSRTAVPWDTSVDDANILHDIYIDNTRVGTGIKIGDGVKNYKADPGSHTVSVCGYIPAGTLFSFGEKTVSVTAGQKAKCDITMLAAPNLSGTITISPNTGATINNELTATYSGNEAVSFQWKKDGSNVGTASTTKPNKFTPTEAGSYIVIVGAAGYNRKTSAPVTVSAPPPLSGNITISPSTCSVTDIALTATYTGSEPVSYQWKNGATNVGSDPITFTPTTTGNYTVTVSSAGHSSKTSADVTVYAAGTGTSGDPFRVCSVDTLKLVGSGTGGRTMGMFYKQYENIDLSSIPNWTAIGNNTTRFTGSYDGNGHTISNLKITSTTDIGVGLFGGIDSAAVVKNVGIVNCNITSSQNATGGVVGANQGGTVQYCYSTGNVTAPVAVGGVVGGNTGGRVQNCYSTCTVTATGYAGGVAGSNTGTVENCYATGNVIGGSSGAGGVVGRNNDANSTVQNCYATGNVTGTDCIGGVVGSGNNSVVENCVALNPNVSGTGSDVERVIGLNDPSGGGTITSGYGRSDMKKNNATGSWWYSNLTGRDGADITAADWGNASWWQAQGFTTANWDFSGIGATNLPKLRNMPEGTQSPVIIN